MAVFWFQRSAAVSQTSRSAWQGRTRSDCSRCCGWCFAHGAPPN